jgi:CO/xanthine dehydrogenase FAD-binding subunit
MGAYLRPRSVESALRALDEGGWTLLAGGTDHYPARVGRPRAENVLDLSALDGLRGISRQDGATGACWRIGALTTWTDVIEADLPALFDGLKRAAREVGGVQIQNRGTVAGNLCNASPAADGVPPLLALDAVVELASSRGRRELPLDRFILGNRRTARAPDEIVTAIRLPEPDGRASSAFVKLGARRYLVISIVMAAATVEWAGDGRVANARIAVGACSEVARRLPALEAALIGAPSDQLAATVLADHVAPLAPIDDVRADADYRREAALILVRRALTMLTPGTA